MDISFHNEDISLRLPQIRLTRKWIRSIAYKFNKEIGFVNFIFCSDNYLLDINRTYLHHNYYTDIITFPYKDEPLESDIYISIDRVRDNARNFNVSFDTELRRVMAHGILHLCGFSDNSEKAQELMSEEEDLALESWAKQLKEKKGDN